MIINLLQIVIIDIFACIYLLYLIISISDKLITYPRSENLLSASKDVKFASCLSSGWKACKIAFTVNIQHYSDNSFQLPATTHHGAFLIYKTGKEKI